MDILGVGPLELLFIFLIALIVLGPQDMKKTGLMLGRFMRKIVTSQGWRDFQQGWRNLRYLPNKMMREAGLEEDIQSINQSMKDFQKLKPSFDTSDLDKEFKDTEKDISSWLTPPTIASPPAPSLGSPEKTNPTETANLSQNDPETEATTSSPETGSTNA